MLLRNKKIGLIKYEIILPKLLKGSSKVTANILPKRKNNIVITRIEYLKVLYGF